MVFLAVRRRSHCTSASNWESKAWKFSHTERKSHACALMYAPCRILLQQFETIQGLLSTEVNGRTVGTFGIVRYIVGVRFWGVSVKRGSTVRTGSLYCHIYNCVGEQADQWGELFGKCCGTAMQYATILGLNMSLYCKDIMIFTLDWW